MPRAIVHLDADAFFASVEQAADPRLRGKPIAVGGEKRGIIASASYEARKFGIYTPMPSTMARRLCPKLILLPGDFDKYELFSRLMFSYAYDFTPDVEIGSIDEGYFDLSGTRKPALNIAETIRNAIRQSLKLSVSEGIAANKLVSQIASKLRKPFGFECVPPTHEAEFLSPLANKWLPGVGPKTSNQLNAAGLAHIGQIAQTPVDLLCLIVGNQAPQLRNFSLGIDERPVIPMRAPAKSYGEQETFAADTTDEEFLEATLRRMADKLMAKVREDGKSIRTLAVKVRYSDMDEEQASESLVEPTHLETEIYSNASALLRKAWRRRVSLRLVSLKLSNVYDGVFRGSLALDIAARQRVAQERLANTVDELRQKYGRSILQRGHDFILRAKNSRGQEPGTADGSLASGVLHDAPHRFEAATADKSNAGPPATKSPPHNLAVVQRQRIGNSFARVTASPGPELRFRIETKPPSASLSRSTLHAPRSTNYVPLNVHSYYSFLDSTLSTKAIIELAKRHELPAIALTDKNNLHGAVEFAQLAAEAGVKPIIGVELDWHGHRICLYAQNQKGYTNLCRILNSSAVRKEAAGSSNLKSANSNSQFSIPPLSDFRLSSNFDFNTDDLLAASSAAELARFFPDRFYLEVNNREAFEKRDRSLPCVASFPVHYELPSDRWKYDIVQSIRTLTLLRQQHPEKRLGGRYHFRNAAEMRKLFAAHPELLAHSLEIAERCSFTIAPGKPQFPPYPPPDGSTPSAFLRRLVLEGFQRRYPLDHARLKPQLEEELAMIVDVGYEEYFLIMWDILQECRRRGIEWITRGSAADSLACYCLEISGVCPIRFDLYFRRFLNKERMALNKLPDIDIDFPHDRKDDVIDLIFEKYGPSQVAVVGGFSTFQSRSAFAEVAKVLGVSEFQVRRLTEHLPHFSRASELAEVVGDTLECRDLPLDQEPYSTALRMARFLDGFPRYPKMHPCGLVLSRQPMDEITPCFISAKGYPTTHFDMDSVEVVGLIKMDILAQGGLAVMRDVEEMRNAECGMRSGEGAQGCTPHPALRTPHFSGLPSPAGPFDDPQVWELIASGSARAVHHIESPAMISLCKMCNVRDIDTLIAIVSVIRPGAANESKKMEFAHRYQGLSPVHYPHLSLEPCLRSTYGLVVYEEHILQMCESFAGLPPGRADVLRRALAKEKTELIDQIQTEFAACARKLGRNETEIAEVWDLVAGFRGYAFCKAHSTAYGVEAYQSAWIKLHYPAEFMAAVLTNGKGFYDPLVYILECHRLGIPLLPPSINEPGPQFTVSLGGAPASRRRVPAGPAIRVPVLQVKGLTNRTKEAILSERAHGEFSSLTDFFLRVQPLPEEIEALIRAGAFDNFGQSRTTQYWSARQSAGRNAECGVRSAECKDRKSEGGGQKTENGKRAEIVNHHQPWLLPPGDLDRLPSVPLVEPTRLQRLQAEEELLGYPASGHSLELFPDIAWETYCPVNRLGEHIGEQIVTCGLVIEQRLFHQVTGEPMKFLTLADWTGIVETELFARTYQSYGLNTIRYRVLEITAKVEPYENNRGHTLRVLRADKPRHHGGRDGALRRPSPRSAG
jgi:DNA-directed DNA polymerase III PolC